MEYFTKAELPGVEIVTFTTIDNLEKYLLSHKIDVLLLGEGINIDDGLIDHIHHLYQLTDKIDKDNNEKYTSILKYQSVKDILKHSLSELLEVGNLPNETSSNQKTIYTIYSPNPQFETLSFSWSLSSIMSEQNEVLLVLFDLFPVLSLSPLINQNKNLSDFIYYLKDKTSLADKMDSLIQVFHPNNSNHAVSYLSGIYHNSDLLSLTEDDINLLIDTIKSNTQYSKIIFHIGFTSQSMQEIMRRSDKLIITTGESPFDRAVLKEWEDQLDRIGLTYREDKTKLITLHKETDITNLPMTVSDLTHSLAWESACRYWSN
jgi:hypothetical protein